MAVTFTLTTELQVFEKGHFYYIFGVCFLLPVSGILISNSKDTHISHFPCRYDKYMKKSNGWEEGFILAHSSRYSVPCWGAQWEAWWQECD